MPGIDGRVLKHCLNVDPMKKPRPTEETSIRPRAKQSSYGRGRKALDYRIYLRGLLPQMACQCRHGKKSDRKWRMCVDFISLNNACPKDSFYLPRID